MHARRKRTGFGSMGTVQSAQPVQTLRRILFEAVSKRSAAHTLCRRLVKARRNPLLCCPPMLLLYQMLQVPSPLNDITRCREDSDQAKGVDAFQGQLIQLGIRETERIGCANSIYDFTTTHGVAFHFLVHGVPVYQRK